MSRRATLRVSLAVAALTIINTATRAATLNVPGDHATIQACINAAVSGVDECLVTPGTYIELIDFMGKAITVRSSGGATVTTIDGNAAGTVVTCDTGEGPGTVLDGFTITNGHTDFGGAGMVIVGSSPTVNNCVFTLNNADSALDGGGGMYSRNGNPTVTNCVFIENSAVATATGNGGGGMYNESSDPTVINCTFTGNSSDGGAGMYNSESSPTVTNCTFNGNTGQGNFGGGMYNYVSSPTVTNCAFTGNSTVGAGGGGIANVVSDSTITNCTFSGNSAIAGGGLYNDSSDPTVTNCTFTGNIATNIGFGGGGILTGGNSDALVANCILWGNSPDEIRIGDLAVDNPTVSYSDLQGGLPAGAIDGGGNIDIDPLFVDADGDDNTVGTVDDNLRLQNASTCIDAGDNTTAGLVGIFTDLDDNERFLDVVVVSDTGNGAPPIVDMGAYEHQCTTGCCPDADADGISDPVDSSPGSSSNSISDPPDGLTATISTRGDQNLCVTDVPDPDGVQVCSLGTTGGGSDPADIVAFCLTGGFSNLTVGTGECVEISCGSSITSTATVGNIDVEILLLDGTVIGTLLLPEANTITYDSDTLQVSAPLANNATLIVSETSGVEVSLAPGATATLGLDFGTSRYLVFVPGIATARSAGVSESIQVTLTSMALSPGRVGEVWWAGASQPIPNAPNADLVGAELACEAAPSHSEVWPVGFVSLFGSVVVPGATYDIRVCDAAGANCSDPLTVATGKWGDVVPDFGGASQPNFADITAVVDKFKESAVAPDMTRTDLGSAGSEAVDFTANFADISLDVDAFKGVPYPFSIPACP